MAMELLLLLQTHNIHSGWDNNVKKGGTGDEDEEEVVEFGGDDVGNGKISH